MGRRPEQDVDGALWRDEEWLRARYEGDLLGTPAIAELAGCSYPTIQSWLDRFGIKRRNRVEAGRAKTARCIKMQCEEFLGRRFGRLVAVRYAGYRWHGFNRYHCWACECDCGGVKVVPDHNLRSGNTKSCGCLRHESPANALDEGEAAFNSLLLGYRLGAGERGYSWELSEEIFRELVTGDCAYCGCPPSQVKSGSSYRGDFVYNGIDRVDNGLGYIEGNVVSCCWLCNSSKGTRSAEEFLALIERIHEYQKRRPINGLGIDKG